MRFIVGELRWTWSLGSHTSARWRCFICTTEWNFPDFSSKLTPQPNPTRFHSFPSASPGRYTLGLQFSLPSPVIIPCLAYFPSLHRWWTPRTHFHSPLCLRPLLFLRYLSFRIYSRSSFPPSFIISYELIFFGITLIEDLNLTFYRFFCQTDRTEEMQLKHDIIRLNKAAKDLNTPDTFVYYAKVKREMEAKRKRLEFLQNQRQHSRFVTYTQSASFFIKYFLPLVPLIMWWNTPMFLLSMPVIGALPVPDEISIVWWSLLCNAVSYRVASLLE